MRRDDASLQPIKAGYFGKVPTQGDFVTRGLSRGMADRFDDWLRQCVRQSQAQMGRNWLNAFLVAPVWRMAMSPGMLGPDAIIGVMMPSVDRAGRYFPFVIAAPIPHLRTGVESLARMKVWFDAAEELALSTLDPSFSLGWLDSQIGSLNIYPTMLPPEDRGSPAGTLWWTGQENGPSIALEHMPQPELFDRLFLSAPASPDSYDEPHDEPPPPPPARTPLSVSIGSDIRKPMGQLIPSDQIVANEDRQAITLLNGVGNERNLNSAVQQVADVMAGVDDPLSMSDLIAGAKGRLGMANSLLIARGAANATSYPIAFATLLMQAHLFAILWAGNARAYLLRDGTLTLLTRDHVDRRLPAVLTKSLGASRQLSPDQVGGEAVAGDRFLLCSGSSTILSDVDIADIIAQAKTPQEAARSLTQNAVIAGTKSSVSAVAAFVSDASGSSYV